MERRLIAAAALLALSTQGCYRPMYAPPYSSQGYPMGTYPGAIQTYPQGQQYIPGSSIPPGSVPLNGNPTMYQQPGYSPGISPNGGPSATKPVPLYGDAPSANNSFQNPETSGGNPLGYAPSGEGFLQTAGVSPGPTPAIAPNEFSGAGAMPLNDSSGFMQPTPTPAPVITSDNFEAGNAPTSFN